MKIIFQIDGGIGKSIAGTAVCKAIKTQFPKDKLYVITGYPEVFLCNPNVDKVFNFINLTYFYQDHIEGQKVKTFLHNPYLETDFINLNGHLIKVWCEMFGIKYNGEQPELFINNRERDFFGKNFGSDKPIMLLQTNGGAPNQPNKYSWTRDLPMATAQQVVNAFAPHYNIVHIRREDQLGLQNTTPLQADFRAVATLISMSSKRLFIDSFCQHAAAALNMPSVVCWIGNTPTQFGYDIHTNIIASEPTIKPELRHSVFSKYNISGQPTEFPYNHEGEIFNASQIIEALMKEPNVEPALQDEKKNSSWSLKDKIVAEANRNSMVARRLVHLFDKTDLGEINCILDIGSWHLGQSIEFSNIFPNAYIHAFEPVPDSYQLCLDQRNKLNDQRKEKVSIHNIALGKEKGEVSFYAVDPEKSSVANVGASSMFKFIDGLNGTPFGQNLIQNEIKVQADTLDNWSTANNVEAVDIMWVDVQGAELLVFQGADNLLKNTKIIMTEVGLKPYYEGHTLKADIDTFLFSKGFKELEGSFELNGFDYEANTIYIKN
jgi:FkbM family methyltransferase